MEDGIKTRFSSRRSDILRVHLQRWGRMLLPSCPRGLWFIASILLVSISLLMAGCDVAQTGRVSRAATPVVEFTSVPMAGADNPEEMNTIRGRVIGAAPGQQIVLYARAQTAWWVQPFADQPFTKIQADSKWSNSTHPGSAYAALLVGPDFEAPQRADVLPTQGVMAFAMSKGEPALWQRWWFPIPCVIAGACLIFALYGLRLRQVAKKLNRRFQERLDERMRVAQELHDTLLQGLLSMSMQLHVAVDQLPLDSPARPGLNRVLQLMGQVIEEGRNTLRGLRSSLESSRDLGSSFSKIPQEFSDQEGPEFRVVVIGPLLALRPGVRDEVYRIGREAVLNAYRHSQASHVEVELEYAPNQLRVVVRDDGCGIDPEVVQSGREGHWGLSGMRERAERVGAKLRVWSRSGEGTEVELHVPSNIAFESHRSRPASNWLTRWYRRSAAKAESSDQNRVA